MAKPLTVYKASAGSGKTFTLAVQYIKLVVRQPQAYRNILAVTFTNKATEEMKMRILSQLYGIWKGLDASDSYFQQVSAALSLPPDDIRKRAGEALNLLLHNYNHFRVMTIDTFFQSVLRNLARELDLAANLRVGLNDVQVEEQAVDQLIEELSTRDVRLQWIMRYIMDNISDDRSWNVIGQIKQFGKTIFLDRYREISRELDTRLADPHFVEDYTRVLHAVRQQALSRMTAIGQAFFDTLQAEGLTADDLANKQKGIASFFAKLRDGHFDESIVNATVAKCLDDPTKWYAKSHPRRDVIHDLAEGPLGHLLRQAVDERPQQWRLYQSAVLTLRHLSQVRLLSSIEQKVRQLNDEANRFLLSDTQKLLGAIISESDTPFIFEKIGTQLDHIMIDEFQDTSTVQWQNFKILLSEVMSRTGSQNLIVGDVKQSIYRWRSGDWQLLNNIEQEFDETMIQTLPLSVNRRSDRRIIEFNNRFFTDAARIEHDSLGDQPEARQLSRAYDGVRQDIPAGRPDDGYVSIRLLATDDYREQTLRDIAATVADLRQRHVAQDRIAILVRTNSYIPLIANYFAEHCPEVNIVSDEAFRLDAALPVNIIVNALRLLTRPDDQLARAFLMKTCGQVPDAADLPPTLSLYELVERLVLMLHLDRYDHQSAYLCAFFDQLVKYTAENPATADDFLRLWDSDIAARTIQSDIADGVRIISIHKSKGLEFDHVIIPFCDWQLEKTGNVLWCYPTGDPFSQLPIAPVDYSQKGMTGTIYEPYYHHEHLQNVVDNLNLLYVAFTRARSGLYIIGKRGARNSRSIVIEQVLTRWSTETAQWQGALIAGVDDDAAPLTFEYGQRPCQQPARADAGADTQPTPPPAQANPFLHPTLPLHIPVTTYPLSAEFRQSNQSRQFLARLSADDDTTAAKPDYIEMGNILHYVFSTIRTTDDIAAALSELERQGVLYDDHLPMERITAMLRKRLEHPQVADWFSDRWQLFNECTILSLDAQGNVVERRPDRVMTDGRQWVVVDFKFGRPRDEYHDQVRHYMSLLAAMGHGHVRGYLWFVYSNTIQEVTPSQQP